MQTTGSLLPQLLAAMGLSIGITIVIAYFKRRK
jgi:hypothetical protein